MSASVSRMLASYTASRATPLCQIVRVFGDRNRVEHHVVWLLQLTPSFSSLLSYCSLENTLMQSLHEMEWITVHATTSPHSFSMHTTLLSWLQICYDIV